MFSAIKNLDKVSTHLKSNVLDLSPLIDLSNRYWLKEIVTCEEWESIIKNAYLPAIMIEEIFSGILSLTLAISRLPEHKFSVDVIQKELELIGFSSEQANQLIKIKSSETPMPNFDRLKDTKWRIDVTISTSQLSRVLEASILMEFNLQSGAQKTIQIPLSQFHNLRYQVATCLKQLEQSSN